MGLSGISADNDKQVSDYTKWLKVQRISNSATEHWDQYIIEN